MHEMRATERDVLYVVSGLDRPSGLDVKRALDSQQEGYVAESVAYKALNALVEKGYLEKEAANGRANMYRLTSAGERLLVDRRQWENDLSPLFPLDPDVTTRDVSRSNPDSGSEETSQSDTTSNVDAEVSQ